MDRYTRAWITERAKKVLETYAEGITVRQLYYRLVAQGMTNSQQHYKRVVEAMTEARWKRQVSKTAFVDRERSMYGRTKSREKDLDVEIRGAFAQVKLWMNSYVLEKWSNQPVYVEVWIEKKALQGVFEGPCDEWDVALAACKGYPSLTFLSEAAERLGRVHGKERVILYFGDYDPSGEDIPRNVDESLARLGAVVEVRRIGLTKELIEELGLPGVPPKSTDSRTAAWSGDEAVELDAVEPEKLEELCTDAIEACFDEELQEELDKKEAEEKVVFQAKLKELVGGLEG